MVFSLTAVAGIAAVVCAGTLRAGPRLRLCAAFGAHLDVLLLLPVAALSSLAWTGIAMLVLGPLSALTGACVFSLLALITLLTLAIFMGTAILSDE